MEWLALVSCFVSGIVKITYRVCTFNSIVSTVFCLILYDNMYHSRAPFNLSEVSLASSQETNAFSNELSQLLRCEPVLKCLPWLVFIIIKINLAS